LIDFKFVEKLDNLREKYGHPLIVSSGYRCPKHNKDVGTTGENGPHTTGHAVDFLIDGAPAMELLELVLCDGGFAGIGLNQKGTSRFIHLDDLHAPQYPRPTIWTY
jgi:uncharacterized protein YcbK (DUF882 family)